MGGVGGRRVSVSEMIQPYDCIDGNEECHPPDLVADAMLYDSLSVRIFGRLSNYAKGTFLLEQRQRA